MTKRHTPQRLSIPRNGVGASLTALRHKHKLTQQMLAEVLHCTGARVSLLELCYSDLTDKDLAYLKERFGEEDIAVFRTAT
jgi:hypothetical protein